MKIIDILKSILSIKSFSNKLASAEFLRYIGPGLFVTMGFIDPGNWSSNIAAGSQFGYSLLWIVTISTIMLIILQHNAAHLGIVSGLCISEAASFYTKKWISVPILFTGILASISTAFAELLGCAIALNMLFNLPITIGAIISFIIVSVLLIYNSYNKLEKLMVAFVSIVGFSFFYELTLLDLDFTKALSGSFIPKIPDGSLFIILSILGAVVMPHNLFLHSEIIQSRKWNLQDDSVIKKQLKYEFLDTLLSMGVGWAINCSIILVAALTFFKNNIEVEELKQAELMLRPLLGNLASTIFAIALLFSGIASLITASIASGSIFAGIFVKPYDIKDKHTLTGIVISLTFALGIIFIITNTYSALIMSQVILSIQLPFTIFLQIYLTSSKKIMGKYANPVHIKIVLLIIGILITYFNVWLLFG